MKKNAEKVTVGAVIIAGVMLWLFQLDGLKYIKECLSDSEQSRASAVSQSINPVEASVATGRDQGWGEYHGKIVGTKLSFRVPVGAHVTDIEVASGTWVVFVNLTYSDGTSESWGDRQDSDRVETLHLDGGAYVKNLFAREGDHIDWLEFVLSSGKTVHFGRSDSSGYYTHNFHVGPGHKVVGLDIWATQGKHPQLEALQVLTESAEDQKVAMH